MSLTSILQAESNDDDITAISHVAEELRVFADGLVTYIAMEFLLLTNLEVERL